MTFHGALITEQGVTFGVIIIQPDAAQNTAMVEGFNRLSTQAWGPVPLVLMWQDDQETPIYQGRKDLVNFLAGIPLEAIPWKEWTLP